MTPRGAKENEGGKVEELAAGTTAVPSANTHHTGDPAILDVAHQGFPPHERIADYLGQGRFLRELPYCDPHPCLQSLEHGSGAGLSLAPPDVGRLTADLFLEGVEIADALESFSGQGRSLRLMKVVELAPDVRPARGFLYLARDVERRVAGESVGLQNALEVLEVRLRMFAPSIGRVGE